MMESVNVFMVVLGFILCANAQDWCAMPGCSTNHIACNNNGNFYNTCVSPSQVQITAVLKSQILQRHNEYRNRIASGQETRFTTARRMAQMVWSDELAFLAQLNTRQCKMSHDACRNTNSFRYSGQNLGAMATSAGHYAPDYVVNDTISRWYNEHPNALQGDINLLTRISNDQGQTFGHFTAVVSERQTAVGCAISRYMSGTFYYSLMACNYASTNMLNYPVYRSGTAASYCTLGKDTVYTGLCTISEPIDPNSFA